MITEDYVSREVAKLLKEKGFNESGHYEYHDKLSKPHFHKKSHNFNGDEYANCGTKWYSAPTHQMAMAWLREVHKIFIEIGVSIDLNGNYHFSYRILDKECKYVIKVCTDFEWTYEDAVEAALKYCLENLILL